MKIKDTVFNEVFGTYFKILTNIVNSEPMNQSELTQLIKKQCFNETDFLLQDRLESFSFLEEINGKWQSKLEHKSIMPLTTLEKRWLKAITADPRISLFIDDSEKAELCELLSDVEPLFNYSDFYMFDQFSDGDDYSSEKYKNNFKDILKAIDANREIHISYESHKGKSLTQQCLPIKIEYSPKNDKFRLISITESEKYGKQDTIFNISNIEEILPTDERHINVSENLLPMGFQEEPVELQIFNERNAVERFMIEFSSYKKESVIDKETGNCASTVYCHRNEFAELLIKILSFGVTIKVLSPQKLVDKIKERILRQYDLIQ